MDVHNYGMPCQPDGLEPGACVMVPGGDGGWIGIVLRQTPDNKKYISQVWPISERSSLSRSNNITSVLSLRDAVIEPKLSTTAGAIETGQPGALCQTNAGTHMRVLGDSGQLLFIELGSGSWGEPEDTLVWYPGWRILVRDSNEFVEIARHPDR